MRTILLAGGLLIALAACGDDPVGPPRPVKPVVASASPSADVVSSNTSVVNTSMVTDLQIRRYVSNAPSKAAIDLLQRQLAPAAKGQLVASLTDPGTGSTLTYVPACTYEWLEIIATATAMVAAEIALEVAIGALNPAGAAAAAAALQIALVHYQTAVLKYWDCMAQHVPLLPGDDAGSGNNPSPGTPWSCLQGSYAAHCAKGIAY